MRRALFASSLLAGLLLLPALPARAQTDVKPLLDKLEATAGQPGYWETIARIEAAGREALPDVAEGLRRANPYVRIGCAKVLYTSGKKSDAVSALLRIALGDDITTAALAANLVSNLTAGATGYGDADNLAHQVKTRLSEIKEASVRIALARALRSLTGGADITPLRTLRETIKTDDPDIKALSALALAEMEEFNKEVVAVLDRLAREPGDRGRLASAFLLIKKLSDETNRQATQKTSGGGGKYAILDEILDILRRQYVDPSLLKEKELIENAAKGMASGLDPYTAYLDEKDYQALMSGIDGKYGGIGARVAMRKDKSGNAWLTIDRPIYSGPAYRAGLRSMDRIIEIEGEISVNRDLTDLVTRLKGDPGTLVTFKVYRRGWKESKEYKLVREQIALETVVSELLPGGVGYLHLTTFGPQSAPQASEALKSLQAQGMKTLILDIRGNSGGLLKAAVDVAGLFIPKGSLVVTVRARESNETHQTRSEPVCTTPMVVMIDGASASASEILAGALQHYGRATCVGERTYGKGSVQQIPDLQSTSERDALRLTIAKYYLPNGKSPQKEKDAKTWGVDPDIKAEPPERDFWKDEAFEKIRQSGKIDDYIKEKMPQHKDLFRTLAIDDNGDPSRYPEIEKLLASLEPPLNKRLEPDDLRELMRDSLRRWVADERGKDFITDFEADVVLQHGIVEALKRAGIDAKSNPSYSAMVKKLEAHDAPKEDPSHLLPK
jgi:carboxyl-terminal processing protease